MIIRYDSTASLRQAYLNNRSRAKDHWHSGGNDWFGGESEERTLRLTELGDTSLVAKAEEALDKLDQTIETPRKVWERAPAGAFCVVPDVLAGLPTPMRRQIQVRDETSPITILAISTSSAGIDAATLAKRGTIILALVMALARVRPVTLQQLTILHGVKDGETVITSEINTHPLDLATACYVLTSAGFARRLTYGLAKALNGFNGSWPKNFSYFKPEEYYEYLRNILTTDPKRCLIIGAAQLGDELLQQPTVWLNKQIARFTSEQEELVA
jgi:hypothetical protein